MEKEVFPSAFREAKSERTSPGYCSKCGNQYQDFSANFCGKCGAAAVLDTPERKQAIQHAQVKIKHLGLVQASLGLVSVICGIVTLVVAWPNIGWPLNSGAPIWVGAFVILAGAMAFLASREEPSVNNTKLKGFVIAHNVLSNLSITFCFLAVGMAVWGFAVCLAVRSAMCYPNFDAIVAICAVDAFVNLAMAVSSIAGTSVICCYARRFGFQSRNYNRGVYFGGNPAPGGPAF